jgi:hypothetical protein
MALSAQLAEATSPPDLLSPSDETLIAYPHAGNQKAFTVLIHFVSRTPGPIQVAVEEILCAPLLFACSCWFGLSYF